MKDYKERVDLCILLTYTVFLVKKLADARNFYPLIFSLMSGPLLLCFAGLMLYWYLELLKHEKNEQGV